MEDKREGASPTGKRSDTQLTALKVDLEAIDAKDENGRRVDEDVVLHSVLRHTGKATNNAIRQWRLHENEAAKRVTYRFSRARRAVDLI